MNRSVEPAAVDALRFGFRRFRPTWTPAPRSRGRGRGWLSALLLALPAGCHMLADPFHDDLANQPPISNPSADAARAAQVEPIRSQRDYQPYTLEIRDGTVTHLPLFFEDTLELPEADDEDYAWTGTDYLCMLYGPARFLANMALFPLSAIDTFPWQEMESDGVAEPRGLLRERFDPVKVHGSQAGRDDGGGSPPPSAGSSSMPSS